jgi:hypothetical protein
LEALVAVLDAQHSQVRARIFKHDLGIELAFIVQRYLHLVGAFNDVIVGYDKTACIHQHARAQRALHLLWLHP